MPIGRALWFAALLATAPAATAQWLPQWVGVWERGAEGGGAALDLQLAPDGTLFAGAQFNRANQGWAALLRFENDGRFAWAQDVVEVSETGGIERLAAGRVAVFGRPWAGVGAFVSVHDGDGGERDWMRESALGRLNIERRDLHQLVEAPSGDLLLRVSDEASGDYVVARYATDGGELPPWRWHAGAHVRATDIAALADGGAIVTGIGNGLGGGYATVRFDAAGKALFDDLEPGDSGSPLGPAYVAVTADGGIVLAGMPEDDHLGVPEATVWKLDAEGARLWKTVLGVDAGHPLGRDLHRFRLAANGDALLVTNGPNSASDRFHLVRIDGADGHVLWDRAFSFSIGFGEFPPQTLAEASNGRLLVGGFVKTEQSTFARIIEYAADGEPCRLRDDESLYSFGAATGSERGWSVFGSYSSGFVAQRYDADGACTAADPIFGDGFEGSARG